MMAAAVVQVAKTGGRYLTPHSGKESRHGCSNPAAAEHGATAATAQRAAVSTATAASESRQWASQAQPQGPIGGMATSSWKPPQSLISREELPTLVTKLPETCRQLRCLGSHEEI